MIRLTKVTCSYPGETPICGLNAALPDSGAFAILGPSGSGKTTLLRLLAGLLRPAEGKLEGLEGKRVSVLFQEDRLLPWLTAQQNAALPCADAERAQALLGRLGLGGDLDKYPDELSGGMKRRVALARALAFGGDVLLLDEPFQGLDEAAKRRAADCIRGAFPLTVLVTHDPEDLLRLGVAAALRLEE